MSNFGFGDLLTKSTDELARQANISTRGDKVLIRSTYDNPNVKLPQSEQESINQGAQLQAELNAEDYIDKDERADEKRNRRATRTALNESFAQEIEGTNFQPGEARNRRSIQTAGLKSDQESLDEPFKNPTKKILKRFLQERSFLVFEYREEAGSLFYSILPFFENITISESQKANFAVYDLIGRAGNVYGYTGSKSRQFNLSFKMNVVHIEHLLRTEGFNLNDFTISIVDYDSKTSRQNSFFERGGQSSNGAKPKFDQVNVAQTKYSSSQQENSEYLTYIREQSPQDLVNRTTLFETNYKTGLNSVLHWLNLVRSSTLNNSKNSLYGPPIIRLNHGMLYNNVPCICTSFTIKENSKTNYDVPTNFAMYYDVTMSLEEIRSLSGEYTPGDTINGDAIAGWNDLRNFGTMDPYNGTWELNR